MTKNLLSKSVSFEAPYAIFEGVGPFGVTEIRLLKTYQTPKNELTNQYARWFIAAKSDMTHGGIDMGDDYVDNTVRGLTLTYASEEFKEQYWETLSSLKEKAGFRTYTVLEGDLEHAK